MNANRGDDQLREEVSEAYEQALKRSQTKQSSSGCCGGGTAPAGVAAKLVDYSQETAGLPEQAVASSFGCGNPLAFSGVQAGQVVLDLGSGAGLDLLIAAKIVGENGRVIGIDMTDAMIDEARRNIDRAGASNVEVRKGIIEKLPVEDASVDWVISNCVINLAPDKEAVFAEVKRVLKPGGHFSISDIVVEELPEELRRLAILRAACIGGAISESEYVDGLRSAGLVDVEVIERLVYDPDQIAALAKLDELSELDLPPELVNKVLPALSGKVWSAKFSGRCGG
jgi:arsenite methyltransferase